MIKCSLAFTIPSRKELRKQEEATSSTICTHNNQYKINFDPMKTITLVIGFNLIFTFTMHGQCTVNYAYSGNTDTITFTNQSTISNAHFYWNFGDGSGSNDHSPVHVYPDDGEYLVTLYGVDTLTNCVDVLENWISVVKPDTFACQVYFTGGIIGGIPQTTNLSTNCSGFNLTCHVFANAQNICSGFSIGNWGNALFLHGMRATSNDSIFGSRIFNSYYRTLPYNYSSLTNYEYCSANFEVTIDYQANGALVTVTAMNTSGNSTFTITGFGNPINIQGSVASYLYPYVTYNNVQPWLITHTKSDPLNGCSSVTCTQTILIRNPYYTWPANCVITQQPQTQFVLTGSTAQFIIDAPDNVMKQWQQDAGLGFVNLTNAGPYSGVNSDTLSISNVQLTMNNYHYRCVLSDSSGFGCHNTSNDAILYVSITSLNEIDLIEVIAYPNPVNESLNISSSVKLNMSSIKVYDLLGKEVLAVQHKNDEILNVSSLNKGMYFLELRKEQYVGRCSFIKN